MWAFGISWLTKAQTFLADLMASEMLPSNPIQSVFTPPTSPKTILDTMIPNAPSSQAGKTRDESTPNSLGNTIIEETRSHFDKPTVDGTPSPLGQTLMEEDSTPIVPVEGIEIPESFLDKKRNKI